MAANDDDNDDAAYVATIVMLHDRMLYGLFCVYRFSCSGLDLSSGFCECAFARSKPLPLPSLMLFRRRHRRRHESNCLLTDTINLIQ